MTAPEACELVIDLVRDLSHERAATATWRLVAQAGLHHAAAMHARNAALEESNARLREELRAARRLALPSPHQQGRVAA